MHLLALQCHMYAFMAGLSFAYTILADHHLTRQYCNLNEDYNACRYTVHTVVVVGGRWWVVGGGTIIDNTPQVQRECTKRMYTAKT